MKNFTIHQGNIPVIIHVPHGGTDFSDLASINPLVDIDHEVQVMADLYTPEIFHILSSVMKEQNDVQPYGFVNHVSRLVFDPERFDSDEEEMNAVGMGVVYSKTSDERNLYSFPLSEEVIASRKHKFYETYSQSLQDLVGQVLDKYGRVVIIDLHSYSENALPYELHSDLSRPEICLGVDEYHTTGTLRNIVQDLVAEENYSVKVNEPFIGTYVPLEFYKVNDSVRSFMLEIRKDVYMDEKNFIPHDGLGKIANTISNIILNLGVSS